MYADTVFLLKEVQNVKSNKTLIRLWLAFAISEQLGTNLLSSNQMLAVFIFIKSKDSYNFKEVYTFLANRNWFNFILSLNNPFSFVTYSKWFSNKSITWVALILNPLQTKKRH